jgi:radical SAM PhpK family P-methyltransferase
MNNGKQLDCIVVGYNETPFETYENMLSNYGADSEAYRDLKFSFVDTGEKKLTYPALLNHAYDLSRRNGNGNGHGHGNGNGNGNGNGLPASDVFKSGDIPNLAAVYLTNFLRQSGFAVKHINLFQDEKEKFISYLAQNPLCVAITTTFYVLNFPVNEMVKFIRQHNTEVKIVVGGPLIANHIRNNSQEALTATLEDIGADIYVTDTQGELTLSKINACLKSGGQLDEVPNIIISEQGKMRRTQTVTENNSLDENYINWLTFPEENLGHTIQTRTARSCAFKCSFCNYPERAGALTLASLETLEKEFDSIRSLGNVKNLVFIDDTFNVPLPRFKDICRMMIRNDYQFNWFSYFRCSNSDEEAFELMAESGCKGVFLGIESGSPTILKNMNKAATIERYADGMAMLRKNGILTFGSFIVGFPGETTETVNETIDFIKATKPDFWRAQMWYCEPGTPIERQRDKYGIEGEGFVWSHNTMESLEAMDHIDRMFLTIDESLWLPQWSFDFWIIPYMLGRGVSSEQFKQFMDAANKLLALNIASVPDYQKGGLQKEYMQGLVKIVDGWNLN